MLLCKSMPFISRFIGKSSIWILKTKLMYNKKELRKSKKKKRLEKKREGIICKCRYRHTVKLWKMWFPFLVLDMFQPKTAAFISILSFLFYKFIYTEVYKFTVTGGMACI